MLTLRCKHPTDDLYFFRDLDALERGEEAPTELRCDCGTVLGVPDARETAYLEGRGVGSILVIDGEKVQEVAHATD